MTKNFNHNSAADLYAQACAQSELHQCCLLQSKVIKSEIKFQPILK